MSAEAACAVGSFREMKRGLGDRKRILVVDDDPLIVQVLKDTFEQVGYDVRVAYDGLEALQEVNRHRPHLVILDILMPRMDGFKVTRLLKFDKRFKDIPIIMLTSRATEGEREIGKKMGADEYFFKPFRLPKVIDIVRRYLNE